MEINERLKKSERISLALGYFDGLHEGHQVVIKNAVNIAKSNNTKSAILMFKELPKKQTYNVSDKSILSLPDKLQYLDKIGVDEVYLLDFSDLVDITAEDYIKNILVKYFSPIAITTGFNHTFGKNKTGTPELLRSCQEKFGYKYFEIPPITCNQTVISSSIIKSSIAAGSIDFAKALLGYRFFIKAKVQKGKQLSKNIGYPSANIEYPDNIIEIPNGVFYVLVEYNNKRYNGILNHGHCPTYCYSDKVKTEVHILDFNENIYDKDIKISFVTKIRDEIKFENCNKLKEQLQRDKAFVEIYKYYVN